MPWWNKAQGLKFPEVMLIPVAELEEVEPLHCNLPEKTQHR
jgi:hypothetical protein